jgi:ribose 5-phosphate isomerase B
MSPALLIASDHGGFILKERLKGFLVKRGLRVKDLGAFSEERCDYPVSAAELAGLVSRGSYKRGILICKSGIGNSIVANRFPGVRAALCCNTKSAGLSREHNDSNVLVLGASFVSAKKAEEITDIWLNTAFAGGRHKKRLALLRQIEKKICEDKR